MIDFGPLINSTNTNLVIIKINHPIIGVVVIIEIQALPFVNDL